MSGIEQIPAIDEPGEVWLALCDGRARPFPDMKQLFDFWREQGTDEMAVQGVYREVGGERFRFKVVSDGETTISAFDANPMILGLISRVHPGLEVDGLDPATMSAAELRDYFEGGTPGDPSDSPAGG